MKIKKIKIKNFRLLKDFQLDLEEDLSLVIGKNNCGKTSLLAILEKFIGLGRNKKDFYCVSKTIKKASRRSAHY